MSIFDDEKNKVQGNWMKFLKVGDKIEGTLISKRTSFNQLSEKDQIIYELKKPDGEYWLVGGKPAIDAQMKHVKLGQIVGFEFVEEREPKRKGFNATKVIQVWQNPKIVDEDWLKEQDEGDQGDFDKEFSGTSNDQAEGIEVAPGVDNEALMAEIEKLAGEKLGATNPEEVKEKVQTETNLAFVETNLAQIKEKLEALPAAK